ncbi:MAG: hypothetical protein Q7S50_00575 [bacterium]|nr:hypothetical protein [bacterium]
MSYSKKLFVIATIIALSGIVGALLLTVFIPGFYLWYIGIPLMLIVFLFALRKLFQSTTVQKDKIYIVITLVISILYLLPTSSTLWSRFNYNLRNYGMEKVQNFEQCGSIPYVSQKDECITHVAKVKGDADGCNQISDIHTQNSCKRFATATLAGIMNDVSLCFKIEDYIEKDYERIQRLIIPICIGEVARINNNQDACNAFRDVEGFVKEHGEVEVKQYIDECKSRAAGTPVQLPIISR